MTKWITGKFRAKGGSARWQGDEIESNSSFLEGEFLWLMEEPPPLMVRAAAAIQTPSAHPASQSSTSRSKDKYRQLNKSAFTASRHVEHTRSGTGSDGTIDVAAATVQAASTSHYQAASEETLELESHFLFNLHGSFRPTAATYRLQRCAQQSNLDSSTWG